MESPGHGADQDFRISFPPVLWKSVQHAHGTVIIHQDPGHRLTLSVGDAACRKVANVVFN